MLRSPILKWIIPCGLLILIAFLVSQSPAERTLGDNIRYVYVHVTIIWAGVLGLTLAGLLSIVVIATEQARLQVWIEHLQWVSFAFFVVGFVLSLLAAKIIWGSISLGEPRALGALSVIGITLILFYFRDSIDSIQIKGMIGLALVVILHVAMRAPLVLHPANPIMSSSSRKIQTTFLVLFALFTLLEAWMLLIVTHRDQRLKATA